MDNHPITTRGEWLDARRRLLEREKQITRMHDEISRERQALPWVLVEDDYSFEGPAGEVPLSGLFEDCSQLLIYHFMFGPDWEEGCPSCSFWADNFDGIGVHLRNRDVAFAAVSRAPYAKLGAYRRRMGWSFPWYSSGNSTFNYDFSVSFTPQQLEQGADYNFAPSDLPLKERQGISAFVRDGNAIYHSYSTYARGVEGINGAYQLLDLTPRGRDEGNLPWPMAWVRRHDQYDKS